MVRNKQVKNCVLENLLFNINITNCMTAETKTGDTGLNPWWNMMMMMTIQVFAFKWQQWPEMKKLKFSGQSL